MSTVAEIESAIATLPPEQVREIAAWLEGHKEKLAGEEVPRPSLIGFMKGKIVLKPGWDEPLDDFREYTE